MRVYVRSFGCSTNLADGEALMGLLKKAGYHMTDSASEADMIIYNTCAVKGPTENRMINLLKRTPTTKKLIVAGCLPLINFERLRRETHFDGVVGPAAGDMILEVSKRVLGGEKVTALENATEAMPRLSLPHAQLNPVISIIPVSYGCLGSCAYCCVTLARGSLRSHRIEDIVERAKNDMVLCARELWITAQDTASYGRDLGTNLAELLRALCHVEGEFWIRVGMMTPNMANDILEELVEIFLDDHVFKFIHLPVQSGNNKTLKLMRRSYSVDDFKRIVAAFRESLPEITVSTDVICGFPGESEDAFEDTLRLIEEVKPDIVNVSKFFARPNTLAAKMKESTIPLAEIRRRSSLAANAAKKVASERNQRWVSWSGEILVDEVGKVANSWVGRNFAYKPIAVKSTSKLHGRKLFVRVVKPHPTYLEAEIVE